MSITKQPIPFNRPEILDKLDRVNRLLRISDNLKSIGHSFDQADKRLLAYKRELTIMNQRLWRLS